MSEMTISQALRRISKVKGEYAEALSRAAENVMYDKTTTPAYGFGAQMERADMLRSELVKLETALRITNAATTIEHGGRKLTLAQATCELQECRGRIAWLKTLPVQAQAEMTTKTVEWDSMVEKRHFVDKTTKCELPEVERNKLIKSEQDYFDTLNDAVETANHRTALKI